MYSVNLIVDADILDAIAEGVRKTPGLMNTAMKRQLGRVRRPFLQELMFEPPILTPANYPLRWKSARQRKFVMAKLRREGNLPYQRTHGMVNSWEVVFAINNDGGSFIASNDDPSQIYVTGDWMQPMHIDNGWMPVAPVIVKYEMMLNDQLIEIWYTVVSDSAGI